jgi:hypothetical protein
VTLNNQFFEFKMPKNSFAKDPSPTRDFSKHFIRNILLGFPTLLIILLIGIIGYRYFENVEWVDSYANSAMIISGVGTLTNPKTIEGKLFVATYSIFGGASFLLVVAVVFSPIFHWVFRQVKVEDREHFKD